jgi:DHA1 family tetracycline resistance protein-like MFS transporter
MIEDSPTPTETVRRLAPLGVLALFIMAPVTLPVPVLRGLVQDRFDVSETLTSLFMSINMVGALIAAPIAGALADRFGRHRLLLVGALCLDAACFFILASPISFPLFLAVRFLEGCAHISALSVLLMLAAGALPPDRRGRAMGVVGGAMMLGVAVGAPIGGFLGQSDVLLPLRAASALAAAAALLGGIASRNVAAGERDANTGFREIASLLRTSPALIAPLAYAFADRFTVGFFTTTFSLYVSRIHGLAPAQIGILIMVFMLPFALLSYPFGRAAERYSITLLMVAGSLLYGLGTMAVGFVGPPALYGLMFAIGTTAAVMFVPSMLMTTQLAPESVRATALGTFNSAGSLGFIVGPLCGGVISQTIAARADWAAGYQGAFLIAGSAELACVALTIPLLLRLRAAGRIR